MRTREHWQNLGSSSSGNGAWHHFPGEETVPGTISGEGNGAWHHFPVMVDEVLTLLQPERGGTFVDCTVGLGGHTEALLAAGAERVVGLDRDPAALAHAAQRLEKWSDRIVLVHADYRTLERVLDERSVRDVSGVLADLGVSSFQLDAPGRGFSFRRDEPLDMRMDPTAGITAADLVARLEEAELADVIYRYGEERYSRRIARAIVDARARQPLRTTGELASVVRRAIRTKGWQRLDPATRTFQALRIKVNEELEGLDRFLKAAAARLQLNARLAVIAFHSLEDRIVKQTFQALAGAEDTRFAIVTKRPLTPAETEVGRNPRARSAKLRGIERQDRAEGRQKS
jgi:16S rRNA (cytosine1402-N4)-methyltransferase